MTLTKTSALADPATGVPLHLDGDTLVTADGKKRYPIQNGVMNLLVENLLDDSARHEMDSFDTNPVIGISYFRNNLFAQAARLIQQHRTDQSGSLTFAEFGGGEGYLARNIAQAFASDSVYVCDICQRYLELAPPTLHRVCCDARRQIFQADVLDAAAYWVSLHHFNTDDARQCLARAFEALKPEGLLILFEPNIAFFPRRILMKMPFLRKKVYFDEEEKHLRANDCIAMAGRIGFEHIATTYVNPPYAWAFTNKLKMGPAFFAITELLHICDRIGLSACLNMGLRLCRSGGLWGMYFMTVLRKPAKVGEEKAT